MMKTMAVLFLSAFAVAVLCGLAPLSSSAAPPAGASLYSVAQVADRVLQKPGSLAWSPDSRHLAFLGDSVYLRDIVVNRQKEMAIPDPVFLSWGLDNALYVLFREQGQKKLCRIEANTLARKDLPIASDPDAIFALSDAGRLLFVSARLEQKRLWTEFSYALVLFDLAKETEKKLFETQKRLPRKKMEAGYLDGWLWTGPSPADTEVLTVEPVKPPVIMPYLQIGLVDYVTGKSREIGKISNGDTPLAASWSPDGRRFAFTDEQRHLAIFDIAKATTALAGDAGDITGVYPSWNPQGSQIYFGGHILTSDGKLKEALFPGAHDSIGVWSPDGANLAVLNSGKLHLLSGFRPSLVPPDSVYPADTLKRISLLKELLSEGLITEQEYQTRRENIIKTRE